VLSTKGGTVALDMFAGKQTMGERAESFKVRPVHCPHEMRKCFLLKALALAGSLRTGLIPKCLFFLVLSGWFVSWEVQLQDEMEVHCGFSGVETGFDISQEDQKFLGQCKLAVVTAAFGGDMLAQPIGMTETSRKKVLSVELQPWLYGLGPMSFLMDTSTLLMGTSTADFCHLEYQSNFVFLVLPFAGLLRCLLGRCYISSSSSRRCSSLTPPQAL